MKKTISVESTKTKPSKERVEKVARQLCQQAGEDPDGVVVWEGEYGYGNYHIPKWARFTAEAKKLIAEDEANA